MLGLLLLFSLQFTCLQDTDCVLRSANCCGCTKGGRVAAVHKSTPKPNCENRLCIQSVSTHSTCKAKKAVCKKGGCALEY